jgi:uncharacterized membrane protein
MLVRLTVWLETLRARLWLIPALGALVAALTAWALVTVDRTLGPDASGFYVFEGGPESARAILSTIAAAMLTFTGLVFSVTMLVLQLASSQLSPRVTRTFLRDRKNQVVLATFVATFVYALLVLREVRSGDEVFVPSIATWWAFVLLLASVGAFIYYIDHMAQSMRIETVIGQVGDETQAAIDRCYPDPAGSEPAVDLPIADVTEVVASPDRPATLQAIDVAHLERVAREAAAVLEVVPMVGAAVPSGSPLVRVRGGGRPVDAEAIRGGLTLGSERTMDQDPAPGIRQLVDIAVRALSPGTNDPTTAVLAVERIHDLLRRLSERAIPGRQRVDRDGALRVVLAVRDWDDHLRLACSEIRMYGSDSSQVLDALRRLLDDLDAVVPDDRQGAVRRQRALLPDGSADEG